MSHDEFSLRIGTEVGHVNINREIFPGRNWDKDENGKRACDNINNCKLTSYAAAVVVKEMRKDKHSLKTREMSVVVGKYFKINVDNKERDLYSKLVNNILNKDTVEIDNFGRRRL